MELLWVVGTGFDNIRIDEFAENGAPIIGLSSTGRILKMNSLSSSIITVNMSLCQSLVIPDQTMQFPYIILGDTPSTLAFFCAVVVCSGASLFPVDVGMDVL